MQTTLGNQLDKYNGVGPGFDLLRIALASSIFLIHAAWATSRIDPQFLHQLFTETSEVVLSGWRRPIFISMLPMFFALSGFLVTSSAFRTKSAKLFLTFRVLRIIPALATEVTLSALVIGPLLTTLSLHQYFLDHRFWSYFGNIIGRVRFLLPGLFESNPVPGLVNGNLWTLAPEYYCYLLVTIAMLFSLFWSRVIFTYAFALATAWLITANTIFGQYITPLVLPGTVQVYYFFAGCLLFHWRDRIPFGPGWFMGAVILSYTFLLSPHAIFIAPLPLTYVAICIGLMNLPRIPLLQRGDYSYGVYLYGFPIAQALIATWPSLAQHPHHFLLVVTIVTFACAAFSWHFIERPFLSLKRFIAPRKKLLPLPENRSAELPVS